MVSAAAPTADRRLDRSTRFFYGLGSVAFGVKDNGFSFMLMLFYNQVLGVPAMPLLPIVTVVSVSVS